ERARTVLPCDGWVPSAPYDDGGSHGPACRVSPFGSTWLAPPDDGGSLGSSCRVTSTWLSLRKILHGIRARERARTVLPCDGWVPSGSHDDVGSFGPACRVSPLGSTWLSMCGSPMCDRLIGSHVRGRVEMSYIDRINEKRRV
ncbi:hypothetical protein DVH24_025805, partial [Malus domestica]